jgi:RecA-family ATPase
VNQTGGRDVPSAFDASTLRPDLVVIDPLVVFCGGGNMNDNAVMSLVMRKLKSLAVKFDCAVLVVLPTACARHISMTWLLKVERSCAQSENVERKPCGVTL